jgi:2-methylfumaryl-CoA isomerase
VGNAPLAGVRIVEISAFVAVPLGTMTLAQLGAEIIRIDPVGGNIDFSRWPVTAAGDSIYWASLNKGKRSVTLDLKSAEGQAIATSLIASAGIVVTNLPALGWLSYDRLTAAREDLIMLSLTGAPDGSPAVDYTVNASSGFPAVTGRGGEPINHVLPAWDVIAGLYVALGIQSAERVRSRTGAGQHVTLALSDVMLATVGNLGYIAEVQANGRSRGPLGNSIYGAYGQDFETADGRRIMVVAISRRHWRALCSATGLTEKLAMIGPMLGVDLESEAGRFAARDAITAVLRPWFASRPADEILTVLASGKVLHGLYQTFEQLVRDDPRCSIDNPMFSTIRQPGLGDVLAPRIPLAFSVSPVPSAVPAPVLGADTDSVLGEIPEPRERVGLGH